MLIIRINHAFVRLYRFLINGAGDPKMKQQIMLSLEMIVRQAA
jgi:hypothetical protein